MAVKLRLRRMGAKNQPFYRIVAADGRYATDGRFLEAIGWYDPKKTGTNFEVNIERVDYWLGKGAKLSDTVKSMVEKARAAAPAEKPAPVEQPTPAEQPVAVEQPVAPDQAEPAPAE